MANRTYTDAALVENQPRITDFIPQRLWTHSVTILSTLASVALVLALYAFLVIDMLALPSAAALLSLATFFFVSTLVEPPLLKL